MEQSAELSNTQQINDVFPAFGSGLRIQDGQNETELQSYVTAMWCHVSPADTQTIAQRGRVGGMGGEGER